MFYRLRWVATGIAVLFLATAKVSTLVWKLGDYDPGWPTVRKLAFISWGIGAVVAGIAFWSFRSKPQDLPDRI